MSDTPDTTARAHAARPRRLWRWLALAAAALLLLPVMAAALLRYWVSGDDFRARVQAQASAAAGVPVTLGAIDVAVWPLPSVQVADVRVASTPPLSAEGVRAFPDWRAALAGRPALSALEVRGAQLHETAAAALVVALQRLAGGGGPADTRWLPRRVALHDIRWQGTQGAASGFDLDARLGEDGWPETASLRIESGARAGTRIDLSPGADGARWQLRARLGGGTVEGPVRLAPGTVATPGLSIDGTLAVRGVDPAALTAPSRPLSGRLTADTTFSVRVTSPAQLARLPEGLRSETRFSVAQARLHGIDLLRAVQTAGLSRGGETALDELSGEVHTQGRQARVRQLVARTGALTARGEVVIAANQSLSGRMTVDVAERVTAGVVGVPLVVGGTLSDPEVTLTRGAMLGAAVGTAVLPGVGTGAGARLGDRIGQGLGRLLGR
ncbi:MAG: hypothetical protein KA795_06640 [Burkholderiaceae bacterium]|nr:hypothetical protein [Burkholderiaceae bacterium]